MKNLAIAKITSPIAVQSYLVGKGQTYINGMILVEIPEEGLVAPNLIPCRYGLSMPYIQVAVGQKVWVEPTIGTTERWVYTGFADSVSSQFSMTGGSQWGIGATQYIFQKSTGEIEIISGAIPAEKMILGETTQTQLNQLKTDFNDLVSKYNALVTAFNAHTHQYVDTPVPGLSTSLGPSAAGSSDSNTTATFDAILSAKVKNN